VSCRGIHLGFPFDTHKKPPFVKKKGHPREISARILVLIVKVKIN
jgi:hypothetical protein